MAQWNSVARKALHINSETLCENDLLLWHRRKGRMPSHVEQIVHLDRKTNISAVTSASGHFFPSPKISWAIMAVIAEARHVPTKRAFLHRLKLSHHRHYINLFSLAITYSLRTVWLNKRRVEKNPTPYWTLSDVSRTHKQQIEP